MKKHYVKTEKGTDKSIIKSNDNNENDTKKIKLKRYRSIDFEKKDEHKKEIKIELKSRVFSIFNPKTEVQWSEHETILIGRYIKSKGEKNEARSKIAAFDLDYTLIQVKGSHKYAKDEYDWRWWKESLNISFDIYVATGKDIYRKPRIGIWKYFIETENNDLIDLENSFYVGDAAGRIRNWKANAPCDCKFAENIGIKFYTPEEFFDNAQPAKYSYGDFNPKSIPTMDENDDVMLFSPSDKPLISSSNQCEIIINVGLPASGKTTFTKKWLISKNNYIHVNQDILKTKAKCIKASKKYNVPIRCFWFQASEALSKHNNIYRALNSNNKIKLIPEVAYQSYKSRFIEPKIEEGFQEIRYMNFVFDGTEQEKKIWQMWYT
ncbi:2260_t:CDS:10 [Entrophospora sp. SA101]|nr:4768_t:CDS:10 [Entrophospora sp. SA101]CAJ0758476.1 2260_t:CDS:10 [Entrophospora sp. SA101]